MNLHWCIEQLRNVRDVDPLGDAEVCDEVAILIHDMERRHWWRVAVDDVAALPWQKQSRDDPGISGRGSEAKDTAAGVGHARIAQQKRAGAGARRPRSGPRSTSVSSRRSGYANAMGGAGTQTWEWVDVVAGPARGPGIAGYQIRGTRQD